MKCYYQIHDGDDAGPWIKGHLMTNGSTTQLHPEDATQAPKNTLFFRADCDCLFVERGIRVTSYMEVDRDKNLYRLMTVDISPGWAEHDWMEK